MRRKIVFCIVAFAAACAWGVPAHAIITGEVFNNQQYTDINSYIGATTFYSNGFTGQNATIAEIEAGFVWDQQESLTQDTVEFGEENAAQQFDQHATWVGSILNGVAPAYYGTNSAGYYGLTGIAPGAALWSGDVATSWNDVGAGEYSTSFNSSITSVQIAYGEALVSGVPQAGGLTADVISSSWGDTGEADGTSSEQILLDAYIAQSGKNGPAKTVVIAAGNSGSGTNSVDSFPAASGNVIDVGAMQSSGIPPTFPSIATFSSRSPSDFFDPATNTEIPDSRALVDLVAPGTDLVAAEYDGQTGGNAFGGGVADPETNQVASNLAGTSFSTPIVAGGAALVVGAGKTLFPIDSNAIDGRIIKSVLMNSASKPAGWNNGQSLVNGVVTTSQALDYTYGAGEINLTQAYSQYTGGTTDVLPSLSDSQSASVQAIGWAYGKITHVPGQTVTEDYQINGPLYAGSTIATTLVWFDDATTDSAGSLDDLDLSVYLTSGVAQPELVAESDALYDSLQHLYFTLPATGTYEIQVSESNYIYDMDGDTTTDFGLAWYVPEPASAATLCISFALLLTRRRRILGKMVDTAK